MIYAENILLCIALPLLLALLFLRGDARRFAASFLTGMVVCLLAAYISGFISYAGGMDAEEAAIFVSPIIEEIMKILPLLFVLFLLDAENEHITLIAVGTGAGFATFENCCYILSSFVERLGYVLVRGMAVGVMHIVSILAVTLGLLVSRRLRVLSFPGVIGALSLSITIHSLYNLLVSAPGLPTMIGYALPLVMAFVLYAIYRRHHRDPQP